MIRKILVPVRGDGKGDNVLAHAAALARRFNAHIAVTHCRATAEDLKPFGVPIRLSDGSVSWPPARSRPMA